MSSRQSVTELLKAWGDGDATALDRLIPIVHGELHRQAERYLRREPPGHTLQPTALVNEAYLRLVDQHQAHWSNRAQFFGVAAKLIAASLWTTPVDIRPQSAEVRSFR